MDSVVPALLTMGTLGGTKMNPDLMFDGTAKQWPLFKTAQYAQVGRFQEPRLYAGGQARDLCNLPGGKRCSCKRNNQIGRDGDGNHLLGY